MFRCNHHHQGEYSLSLLLIKITCTDYLLLKLLLNYYKIIRIISNDYFNNFNNQKAQRIRSLMMVIAPKHVGAVLM